MPCCFCAFNGARPGAADATAGALAACAARAGAAASAAAFWVLRAAGAERLALARCAAICLFVKVVTAPCSWSNDESTCMQGRNMLDKVVQATSKTMQQSLLLCGTGSAHNTPQVVIVHGHFWAVLRAGAIMHIMQSSPLNTHSTC